MPMWHAMPSEGISNEGDRSVAPTHPSLLWVTKAHLVIVSGYGCVPTQILHKIVHENPVAVQLYPMMIAGACYNALRFIQ